MFLKSQNTKNKETHLNMIYTFNCFVILCSFEFQPCPYPLSFRRVFPLSPEAQKEIKKKDEATTFQTQSFFFWAWNGGLNRVGKFEWTIGLGAIPCNPNPWRMKFEWRMLFWLILTVFVLMNSNCYYDPFFATFTGWTNPLLNQRGQPQSWIDFSTWHTVILTAANVDTRSICWSIDDLFWDVTHLPTVCVLFHQKAPNGMIMYDLILLWHVLSHSHIRGSHQFVRCCCCYCCCCCFLI